MKRLAELLEPFTMMMTALELPVEGQGTGTLAITAGGRKYVLELRDHSGPILLREFDDWLATLGDDDHGVLVVMGFYHPKVMAELINRKLMNRIAIVSMGLKSMYDTGFAPQFLGESDSDVFTSLAAALISLGLPPLAMEDHFHKGRATSVCLLCDKLLSKQSFIACPICGGHYCHPDVGICYFQHDCPGGKLGL
jgi:hypothetical protein